MIELSQPSFDDLPLGCFDPQPAGPYIDAAIAPRGGEAFEPSARTYTRLASEYGFQLTASPRAERSASEMGLAVTARSPSQGRGAPSPGSLALGSQPALAFTGVRAELLAFAGLALIVDGWLLVATSRRRHPRRAARR